MKLHIIAILTAAGLLSGCVISVKDRAGDARETAWQQHERDNRAAIARLEIGMSLEQVQERMGAPAFSEGFDAQGNEYRVLFYRTHRVHADGMTTRDETTPLVFTNRRLSGWGESAWMQLEARRASTN